MTALMAALPCAAAKPVASTCPAARAPVHEVFVPADCAACWAAADPQAAPAGWRLDWIVPTTDQAPLAAAALPEAAQRAERAALATLPKATLPKTALRPGPRLRVASGPAWKGYFGVQITLQAPAGQPWPADATAWVALVEQVPAGADGSTIARALVRSVAGPLPVHGPAPGRPLSHLQAMRWPDTAQPTRLQARAWVEAADGRLLAMAADHCP